MINSRCMLEPHNQITLCYSKKKTLSKFVFLPADSLGIGKHKSSKMAHLVLKCNNEDYLSVFLVVSRMQEPKSETEYREDMVVLHRRLQRAKGVIHTHARYVWLFSHVAATADFIAVFLCVMFCNLSLQATIAVGMLFVCMKYEKKRVKKKKLWRCSNVCRVCEYVCMDACMCLYMYIYICMYVCALLDARRNLVCL